MANDSSTIPAATVRAVWALLVQGFPVSTVARRYSVSRNWIHGVLAGRLRLDDVPMGPEWDRLVGSPELLTALATDDEARRQHDEFLATLEPYLRVLRRARLAELQAKRREALGR